MQGDISNEPPISTVKIYGASDDLIEVEGVEGSVRGCDEFGTDNGFVEFSSGDVFRVHYTNDGVWKVDHVQATQRGAPTVIRKEPHGEGDDPEPHTETVLVTGRFEWVRFLPEWPMSRLAKTQAVFRYLEDRDNILKLPATIVDEIYERISVRG